MPIWKMVNPGPKTISVKGHEVGKYGQGFGKIFF